jgi:NADPH:quinone reductase
MPQFMESPMKAILLRRTGGPSVLEYVELPTPRPGSGDVLVRADTIGVSMPEVLVRKGAYAWMPPLPAIPGIEMSGRVVECGPGVADRAVGDKVFVSARDLPVRAGCYAEYIAVPARAAHQLPPECDLEAAACLSNYQVAYHLLFTASRGIEAKSVAVHTAAGGVGSAAVQLARIAGMRVIGVAGSDAKTRAVLALGAEAAINYRTDDVVARVREATGGRGADLILDPIGGKGFARNFAMLASLGLVVSYGRLDGPPDPGFVAAMRDHHAVSPAVRFFTIHSFDDRPDIRAAATKALVDWLAAGEIKPLIHARLPLSQAHQAHEMLEAGEVIGKIVMKPENSVA